MHAEPSRTWSRIGDEDAPDPGRGAGSTVRNRPVAYRVRRAVRNLGRRRFGLVQDSGRPFRTGPAPGPDPAPSSPPSPTTRPRPWSAAPRVERVRDLPATRSCTKPASDPHADYWALVTQSVERQPPEAEGCGFKSHPETRAGVVLDVRSTILPLHHSLDAHRLVGPAARRQVPQRRQLSRKLRASPVFGLLRQARQLLPLGYRNPSPKSALAPQQIRGVAEPVWAVQKTGGYRWRTRLMGG